MLRITTGKFKNKTLKVPPYDTRPITDRIRISIFDLIQDFLPDAEVLDLYAGSGATGLEAISRGAQSALFVDISFDAYNTIKSNISTCGVENCTNVIKSDVHKFLHKNTDKKFDLIFLDPPFINLTFLNLDETANLLKHDGLIVARIPSKFYSDKKKNTKDAKLEEVYSKKYGSSQVVFYKLKV